MTTLNQCPICKGRLHIGYNCFGIKVKARAGYKCYPFPLNKEDAYMYDVLWGEAVATKVFKWLKAEIPRGIAVVCALLVLLWAVNAQPQDVEWWRVIIAGLTLSVLRRFL